MELPEDGLRLHLILNAYWEPLAFELPPAADPWRRWIDTALESPEDIVEWQSAPPSPGTVYLAGPRSVVALFSNLEPTTTQPPAGCHSTNREN
jgi:glycogen operon protein